MPYYVADLSPFGVPHKLDTDKSYVAYKDLHANFVPYYGVSEGAIVADIRAFVCGKCVKMGRIKRKKVVYATIEGVYKNGRNKNSRLNDCVGVPAIKEFVRHRTTKKWFQMCAACHTWSAQGTVMNLL